MNLKNQQPVFVPAEFSAEIEKLSKAALMDMVWDYAAQNVLRDDPALVMEEFRKRREIIQTHRAHAKDGRPR